jgi:hypothetical protein
VRECALAGPRRARGGETDREGPRRREREKRGARGNGLVPGRAGPRDRERRGTRSEATGADKSAPLGSEREGGKGARDRLSLTGGARLSGAAGTRARGLAGPSCAGLGQKGFSFFPEFPNSFSISFSRIFNSKFKLGFKFELIQTCATIQRIFKLSMI